MALALKGEIELSYPGQLSFTFEDITGVYASPSNLGGYGTPNPAKADVIVAKLFLTPPGSDDETEITDFDYLPTDAEPITIDCTMYNPDDEEVEDDEESGDCEDCPDIVADTDCDPEDATCFMDGCWTFRYDVRSSESDDDIIATTTFKVLFYGITRKRIADLAYKNLLRNGNRESDPVRDQINAVKNDFDNMIFTAATKGCGCDCVAGGIESIQKRLTTLENTYQ